MSRPFEIHLASGRAASSFECAPAHGKITNHRRRGRVRRGDDRYEHGRRGVDIKLGGDLAEEIISAVNRVLRRAGYKDPFDMPLEERRQALQKVDPTQYGLYDAEVKHFLQYFEDMERVKQRGGLHVIGSERHEARRIDNQLRGRSARQGDPGSSRFYLSLEDDLMRLFGGDQVSGLMQRLKVDDSLPLEARMVSGIIENSQHRVEGANFDVRKHLLEYDDVLNQQREQIYSQRDRFS